MYSNTWQSILFGEGGKDLSIIMNYAAAEGTKPEITFPILVNQPQLSLRQFALF